MTRARLLPLVTILGAVVCAASPAAQAACEVRYINRGQADEIDEGFRDLIIPRIGEYQRAVVQTALDALPEVMCAAVRRIVFVHVPGKDATAFTNTTGTINEGRPADLIYFNDAKMPEQVLRPTMVNVDGIDRDAQESARLNAVRAVIHEAVHVADHLLDSQRKADIPFAANDEPPVAESLWSGNALRLAREVVRQNQLRKGFREEWTRLHEAFVAADMAREYYGKDGGMDLKDVVRLATSPDGEQIADEDEFGRERMLKPAPIEFAAAGFMTRYGGTKPSEDIAEMAASLLARDFVEDIGATGEAVDFAVEDHACKALQRRDGPNVPANLAAFFTKLNLLRTVGFVTEKAYERCVGPLKIQAPGEGFFTYQKGSLARSYTGPMGARLGRAEADGPIVFQLTGEGVVDTTGGAVPVDVTLTLNVSASPGMLDAALGGSWADLTAEDVSFARGVYFLGYRHGKYNRLSMNAKDDGRLILDVGQGVALVARASREGVEGSIFVQRIFNFSGGALSAIGGDEVVREPTSITFRYDGS